MTKYYCDYCDVFLTHDAPSVRRDHITGWKHRGTVTTYFQTVVNQDKMARAVGEIIKQYEERREFVPIPVPEAPKQQLCHPHNQHQYPQQAQIGMMQGQGPVLMRPGVPMPMMPNGMPMPPPIMPNGFPMPMPMQMMHPGNNMGAPMMMPFMPPPMPMQMQMQMNAPHMHSQQYMPPPMMPPMLPHGAMPPMPSAAAPPAHPQSPQNSAIRTHQNN
jgi:U1 small nuclear ribonucleoprotein C